MRKRQRRKATAQAIEFGDPVPDEPHDVVRVYDRGGGIAFEQDWGTNRPGAMAQEARIIDDLLHLDVHSFRARYGIAGDKEAPPKKSSRPARGGTPKAGSGRPSGTRKSAARKPAAKKGAPRSTGRPKRRSG